MLLRDLYNDAIKKVLLQYSVRLENKTVRKYRCTSGTRKGRIVAKPATCNAPKNMKASNTLKQTRRKKGSVISTKSNRTKRTNPASQRLKRLNTGRRTISKTKRRGARI